MPGELQPSCNFAGYRIERLVGRGGMGAVYRARRLEDGADVALKVILDEHARNPGFVLRFEREARLAAALEHPHLVPVRDAGTWNGIPYLAMAFVDGFDLEALLAARGPLHPATAARIVAQVASALDVAHAAGLVHRDVKPGNVLLERRDPLHAYLADFGLSRHVDSTSGLTGTGAWVGSIDYAAPEQVQSAGVDARTDVYGLGCVLYEASTGTVPFPRRREVDKLLARLSGPAPAVSATVPQAPPALDAVVRRATAVAPDERFQTAGELAQAALDAAREAGPEPAGALDLPDVGSGIGSDAPTAG